MACLKDLQDCWKHFYHETDLARKFVEMALLKGTHGDRHFQEAAILGDTVT